MLKFGKKKKLVYSGYCIKYLPTKKIKIKIKLHYNRFKIDSCNVEIKKKHHFSSKA